MTGPNLFGVDLFGNPIRPASRSPMGARFIVPPFSVLDARQGEWQERKRAWIGMGIKSEEGRPDDLIRMSDSCLERSGGWTAQNANVSIFDPVLCEIAYRWFAPPGGLILDPFAGSCTTGVAAKLEGRKAVLIEISEKYCEIGAERLRQGVLF